jgi:hypothetical protein
MLKSLRLNFVAVAALTVSIVNAQTQWNSSTSYPTSSLVIGSDTNLYRAVAVTEGNNPTTDSGTNWTLYTACAATTLAVSSGGRFATLTQAYAFIQDATITHNGPVTISIATGYTTTEPGPVTFSNPYGQRISVVGGGSTSVLNFGSAFNGIVVSAGRSLGNFSGVALQGPTITTSN